MCWTNDCWRYAGATLTETVTYLNDGLQPRLCVNCGFFIIVRSYKDYKYYKNVLFEQIRCVVEFERVFFFALSGRTLARREFQFSGQRRYLYPYSAAIVSMYLGHLFIKSSLGEHVGVWRHGVEALSSGIKTVTTPHDAQSLRMRENFYYSSTVGIKIRLCSTNTFHG